MTHIDERTFYKCMNCGEDYGEFDWRDNDYRCPECNGEEYIIGMECEDCGRFVTADNIIDGWHKKCAKEACTEELAVKYISWQARVNVEDSCGRYELVDYMREVKYIGQFMEDHGLNYQGYALDDLECWVGFLNDMEEQAAKPARYNMAEQVAQAAFA